MLQDNEAVVWAVSATHIPDGDGGIGRPCYHLVVLAADMETPHLVLVGVQGLHTFVGLDGPQLH